MRRTPQSPPASTRAPGLKSSYWDESVELVRLNADIQAMAVSLLSAKLKFPFVGFDGARVAPVSFCPRSIAQSWAWVSSWSRRPACTR